MQACVIHKDNLGEPRDVFMVEDVPVPDVGPDDVLVKMNTTAIHHNTSWIASGKPVNVVKTERHIGGSGGVGIVTDTGVNVTSVEVGQSVFLTCNMIVNGALRILGYETPGGTFAEYCCVKDYMCIPLTNTINKKAATVFNNVVASWQMLFGWEPHVVKPGSVVLIWGASGSIGSIAVHLVRKAGGIPIAVTSSAVKQKYCMEIGAEHVLNRKDYPHLNGVTSDNRSMNRFIRDVRRAGGKLPDIVFEHSGVSTLATSVAVCDKNGMIVLCGATSGYEAVIDVRRIWVQQKRFQGSHYYDTKHTEKIITDCQDSAYDNLVTDNQYTLHDIGELTSQMRECNENRILNNIIINVDPAKQQQ